MQLPFNFHSNAFCAKIDRSTIQTNAFCGTHMQSVTFVENVLMSTLHGKLLNACKDMEKIKDALKRNPEREWWGKVILRLFDSPHCRGKNDRGWKASFDFMVSNAEVILDGKYDGGKGQSAMLDRRTAAQKFIERGQKDG